MATQRFYDGQPGPDIRRELNNFEAKVDGTVAAAQDSSTAALASKNAAATSATAAKTSETNAASSASAAAASQTAAATSESAALASKNAAATSATAAKTSETNAASSASAAAASAGGQLWVSGTTYAVGALVFSAVTGRNYRRIVAGAGTTDPSADGTNWRAVLLDVDTCMPTIRPTLLLDFVNSRSVDPRITLVRATPATRTNERRMIETVAANVPRIDFDPVSGACIGLLIEESRTNYITNNTMQGVVVGSPGTTPTGWSVADTWNGITRTVVATGEEDGISYVDVRFNGTPTITYAVFGFAGTDTIAAVSGQMWALSTYLRLVGGSLANTSPVLDILETDGTNAVGTNPVACVATSAPLATQRFVNVTTVDALGVAYVQPRLRVGLTIGQPIDFTLRIGMPQFEADGFATSVIRTTGAAATRAAEVASMTGSNFSSWYRQDEGAFVAEYFSKSGRTGKNSSIFSATASAANRNDVIGVFHGSAGSNVFSVSTGGVAQTYLSATLIFYEDAANKVAASYGAVGFARSINGTTAVAGSPGVLPTVNTLLIGSESAGGVTPLCGHIARIAYYPKRLSNAELQALTTP